MKPVTTIALLLLLPFVGWTQQALRTSRSEGHFTRVYKLTDKETKRIIKGHAKVSDAFLHTQVDNYKTRDGAAKELPFGNYLKVIASKNKLEYQLDPKNNVQLFFINNEKEFQFCVTDLLGNIITDAVAYGSKGGRIKYNKKANLFKGAYPSKDGYIKIVHKGVSNFFEYEYDRDEYRNGYKQPFLYRIKQKFAIRQVRSLFKPERSYRQHQAKYKSIFIFSKPKYKPGETVKFKSYVLSAKGLGVDKKRADLVLATGNGDKKLATINAYRDGGFEYQFVLDDSLRLTLDQSYTLKLVDSVKGDAVVLASGSFYYEDYELKSLSFAVRADKETQYPGEPITLYMKASDENELVVPDARVEIVARTRSIKNFVRDSVFVPDTLWVKNMNLDPVGETKLEILDSIFTKAAISFALDIRMLNSNNESREERKELNYEPIKEAGTINAKFVKDSLYFDYTEGGVSKSQTGWLYKNAGSLEIIDSQRVVLPLAIKADYRATDFDVKLDNKLAKNIDFKEFEDNIRISAVHNEKEAQFSVINEHKIPFWYTVFSGNKVLLKGYATTLDTLLKHSSKKAVHFRINYIWDEEEKHQEVSSAFYANALNIKLLAPDVVYPGKKTEMKVLITDARQQPVSNADVTAYAHTTKFKSADPNIPYFGKGYLRRKNKRHQFESEDIYTTGNFKLKWQTWGNQLGLDTIEYYKFTHPESLYTITENVVDSITQFAPFVMKDGDFEPVNIIYVDEVPVFFDQTDQIQHYSFPVKPGKHTIGLRTPNYHIWMKEVIFKKGVKTILSLSADTKNTKAVVKRVKNKLSTQEAERLNNYMMRVQNSFGQDKAVIEQDSLKWYLSFPPSMNAPKQELLVGPVYPTSLYYRSGSNFQQFLREPGYTYTFSPGLIKQKSFRGKYAFDTLMTAQYLLSRNYKQEVVSGKFLMGFEEDYLNSRSRNTQLFNNQIEYDTTRGQLRYSIDTAFTNHLPYIKNIFITNPAKPHVLMVFRGEESFLPPLPAGIYDLLFLLKDNRYFKAEGICIKPNGINYYRWSSFKVAAADSFSNNLDAYVKGTRYTWNTNPASETIVAAFNAANYDYSQLKNEMSGRVVTEKDEPIAGATVSVVGLNGGVVTNKEGRFRIKTPAKGQILVSMVGYDAVSLKTVTGDAGSIRLIETKHSLDEVVVIGYGVQRRVSLTGASTTITSSSMVNMIEGRVAGISITDDGKLRIRGVNSLEANSKPLIIVDGVPFDGDMNSLNPADFASLDVLKDAAATAIYGARAKDGVIIIKTNKNPVANDAVAEQASRGQNLRSNFSDEGFWQPKLITDGNGVASFTVTFPDDITSWKTRVVAATNKKQTGSYQTTIRSFKTLSANFVSPQFAVEGDSMYVMGKLMNYTSTAEVLNRVFRYNGNELLNTKLTVSNAHLDTVLAVVKGTDSLQFEYSLQQDNGYFDGELRKVPVFAAGVKETVGQFSFLSKDTTLHYHFQKDKGPGTVRAETSVFPILLDEMQRLREYQYLCNEQLASKLKSLLLEKKLRQYLQQPFNHEKNIRFVLKKLDENKTMQGLWGWWLGAKEEPWISLHVVEALLQAEAAGYKINLNKNILYRYLIGQYATNGIRTSVKHMQLLNTLGGKEYLKDWVTKKEQDSLYRKSKKTQYAVLEMMQLKLQAGLPITLDSLVKHQKQTMFGAVYWGDESYHFWDNSVQTTLQAYTILKASGNNEILLQKIRQYFLEQRRNGQWRNTYESSLILETILPDLFVQGEKPKPESVAVNGEAITQFPFEKKYEAGETITLKKEGAMPVYFTAYQQFQNKAPEKISKDFTVNSRFVQNGNAITQLKAGKLITLEVEVIARADGGYVMVEVPIPAGCSYENKSQSYWGQEVHREYFKEKVSIFCSTLKQGRHVFTIDLMPRYSGSYILNPAKAEMMYFPVFYGREGMKKAEIK